MEQEKPLRGVENTVKVIGAIDPPRFVIDLLSFGPKHPVRDEFNEMHFLADVDRLLCDLDLAGEQVNEVQAAVTGYVSKMKKQKPDRAVRKVSQYLKKEDLKAVPFDKGAGYCLMSRSDYEKRLEDLVNGPQFCKGPMMKADKSDVLVKSEDSFNKKLMQLMKNDKISQDFYSRVRSTGAQPARLYGLAKVHKQNTPLRPILSLPGSCYENLTEELSKLFDKVPSAGIETNTEKIKAALQSISLDDDEVLVSLDVVSLYTNVPVKESIEIAAEILYSLDEEPPFDRRTFTTLMEMAVTDIKFTCNRQWVTQRDGVAMGSKLAVILANIWLKQFEFRLARTVDKETLDKATAEKQGVFHCSGCQVLLDQVDDHVPTIQCFDCGHWSHYNCAGLSLEQLKVYEEQIWQCGCIEENNIGVSKLFARYVDDMLRVTKRTEIDYILQFANSLHPQLACTIEFENTEQSIPFLDMRLSRTNGCVSTGWYTKPTDTGLYLSFHALAPKKYKRNIVEGTVHRLHHCTSTWEAFHVALATFKKHLEKNQYPPAFFNPIIESTISNILSNSVAQSSPASDRVNKGATFVMQYRGLESSQFAKKLRKIASINTIFTTRKLRSVISSLKDPIPQSLQSRVVYELTCSGCQARYVGQTTRHLATRLGEHCRKTSPVGDHLRNCAQNAAIEHKIIDKSFNVQKLLTLEALHISRLRPTLNQREEYRSRELTIRLF